MNRLFFLILTIVTSTVSYAADADPFAEIKAYLTKPEEKLDVGFANILIGKLLDPSIITERYVDKLDTIFDTLRPEIEDLKKPEKIIAVINSHLFKRYGLSAVDTPYPEDFLVDELMDTGKGRCMSLVALYSALAFRLDLPITGVCMPGHIFARWSILPKRRFFFRSKGRYINIETTQTGARVADEHYASMMGSIDGARDNPFYFRSLTRRELIAAYLSPLGSALRDRGRLDEAIEACRLSVSINPNDAEAWNNLGMTYRLKGMKDLAIISYNRALTIYPGFAEAWHNQGSVQEDNEKRIYYYKKAITLKPSLSEAWRNLVLAYYQSGNYQLAWACVNRCHELGHTLSRQLIRKIEIRL